MNRSCYVSTAATDAGGFQNSQSFLTHTGPIFRKILYSSASDLCKASGIPCLPDTAKISVVFSGKCVIIYKIIVDNKCAGELGFFLLKMPLIRRVNERNR